MLEVIKLESHCMQNPKKNIVNKDTFFKALDTFKHFLKSSLDEVHHSSYTQLSQQMETPVFCFDY